MVTFTIFGSAVAKERPRFGNGVAHTPEKTKRYEEIVQAAAIVAMGNSPPMHGPVELRVIERRAPPASWSAGRRRTAADGGERPCTKPDLDNVVKTIKDALNEICYLDDAQVCRMVVEKRYDHEPSVVVEILPCA